jgi:hypothetical protein
MHNEQTEHGNHGQQQATLNTGGTVIQGQSATSGGYLMNSGVCALLEASYDGLFSPELMEMKDVQKRTEIIFKYLAFGGDPTGILDMKANTKKRLTKIRAGLSKALAQADEQERAHQAMIDAEQARSKELMIKQAWEEKNRKERILAQAYAIAHPYKPATGFSSKLPKANTGERMAPKSRPEKAGLLSPVQKVANNLFMARIGKRLEANLKHKELTEEPVEIYKSGFDFEIGDGDDWVEVKNPADAVEVLDDDFEMI